MRIFHLIQKVLNRCVIILTGIAKSIKEYLTFYKEYIDFESKKVIWFEVKKTKNDMKNDKTEPWNNQNAPMSKNGAKWALIISVGLVALVFIGMMIFAAFSK
ncbi:MAG: hypothetical protein WAZ12_04310 [Candidatus Absconditicoccaceae bacterium]